MEYFVANFKITCPNDLLQTARDLLADAAGEAGFESFEDTDDGLEAYVQKSLFNSEILDNNIKEFPLQDTTITYTVKDAENKDWNQTWEDNGFEPIDIDGKILIVDAHHDKDENNSNHKVQSSKVKVESIKIDPRLAVGTGTHETTQMIVSTLLSISIKDKRVLDCGCGTGILSIAASKLGAKEVVAYDIDEWSVDNTRHNAELNNVNNINVLLGDASILNNVEGQFDIVLANINRNILLHDMPSFRNKMGKDALLILSGFYEEDIPLLEEKANELGLSVKDKKEKEQWRMLLLK